MEFNPPDIIKSLKQQRRFHQEQLRLIDIALAAIEAGKTTATKPMIKNGASLNKVKKHRIRWTEEIARFLDDYDEFTIMDVQTDLATDLLEHASLAVLTHQSSDGDLTIVLTDNAQLHELNQDYLGIDAPTDVLSFPASETDPETARRYLGDILISVPRAEEQAQAAGHALESEIQLLIVHGTLHLLGYDHAGDEDKARMWKVQAEILEGLGLRNIEIREQ